LSALGLTESDLTVQTSAALPSRSPSAALSTNGVHHAPAVNGNGAQTAIDYPTWRYQTGMIIKESLDAVPEEGREYIASMTSDGLAQKLVEQARELLLLQPRPAEFSDTDVDDELHKLAAHAVEVFRGAYLPAVSENHLADYVVSFELHGTAILANEEYLKRDPVVAGLCYASAVSMVTGGKHAGKSTLARWMAVCVAKGFPFLEREVQQGEVLYLASADETMAARQELLRLGWGPDDPIKFLSMSNVTVDQLKFIEALSDYIRQHQVKLIIMDMLFDFARITDEMSYAQTREALGVIQKVADVGNCHVVVVHHAPKYMTVADAAVTALGSQGLAARVSPIIQVRRHGPGVHSVLSTAVRDPRGEAVAEKRLTLNEDGSLTLGKVWKDWMQAEVFAPRVLELFETEPGQEQTRGDVQEALGISQPLASTCLKQLHTDGKLHRSGTGKKGSPYRYCIPLTEISDTNEKSSEQNGIQVSDLIPSETNYEREVQGRFGYKDNYSEDDLDEHGISRSK
jgi:hypothetical protein